MASTFGREGVEAILSAIHLTFITGVGFVVTHRSRQVLEWQGRTSFTFVTDGVERAIELAKDADCVKDAAVGRPRVKLEFDDRGASTG